MKCPGCNFVCSELRDLCPKCVVDLRPFKRNAGLPITHPTASYAELLSKATGKKQVPSTPQRSKSFFGGLLSALSQISNSTPITATTDVSSSAENDEKKENNDIPIEITSTPTTETLEHQEITEDTPSSEVKLNPAHLEVENEPSYCTEKETLASSDGEVVLKSEDSDTFTLELEPSSEEREEVSPEEHHPTHNVTEFLFTDHSFPSLTNASGPHFKVVEWLVPTPERRVEGNKEALADAAPTSEQISVLPETVIGNDPLPLQDDNKLAPETTELHTLNNNIEAPTPSTHAELFHPEIAPEPTLPAASEDTKDPVSAIETNSVVESQAKEAEETPLEEPDASENPLTPVEPHFTATEVSVNKEEIEEAFGIVFSDIKNLTAAERISAEHLFVHSNVEQEQILLQFALALDELEGRLPSALTVEVSSSADKHVETEALDSALEAVETFIDKADQPVPLNEFIQEKLSEHNERSSSDAENQSSYIVARFAALLLDVCATIFFCLLTTSTIERGGLTELLADMTVNGIRANHEHWVVASLALGPICYIVYQFAMLLLFQASLGEKMLGLNVRNIHGRPLRFKQIVLRSLCAPLALLFGGPLPLIRKKYSVLDFVSTTELRSDQ